MASQASTVSLIQSVPTLAPRSRDSHKGSFGHVLVVAGSRGMSGAAILCASAALRGGAGLVTVAVPESILPIVACGNPCYMTRPLPPDGDGRLSSEALPDLLDAIRASTVTILGPGLGRGPGLPVLLRAVLEQTRDPLVLDADGLNALPITIDRLRAVDRPVILTPHPGEFARLLGRDVATVQSDRLGHAARFAGSHGCIVVLKGHGTVVTDGQKAFVNTTGNPGMATGGTGDVLGGLIGALLAQGLEAFSAAQLGVYLHGLAGDLARDQLGEASLIATDVLDHLPGAFRAQLT